jgi:hypothetical protein
MKGIRVIVCGAIGEAYVNGLFVMDMGDLAYSPAILSFALSLSFHVRPAPVRIDATN